MNVQKTNGPVLKQKKVYLFLLVLLVLVSCSSLVSNPQALTSVTVKYRIHEVKYPGETLGEISEWYTGSSNNWRRILSDNGYIKTKSLNFGDKIRIDEALMTRKTRMPRAFVKPKPVETDSPRAPATVSPDVTTDEMDLVSEQVLKDQLLESIISETPKKSEE